MTIGLVILFFENEIKKNRMAIESAVTAHEIPITEARLNHFEAALGYLKTLQSSSHYKDLESLQREHIIVCRRYNELLNRFRELRYRGLWGRILNRDL